MVYRGPGFFRGRKVWRHAHALYRQYKIYLATHRKTEKERQLGERREGAGWGRSRIILPQESLVVYKSFYTLWVGQTYKACRRKSILILYNRRERKRILKKHRSERQNKIGL
jgi:hypothetical protein